MAIKRIDQAGISRLPHRYALRNDALLKGVREHERYRLVIFAQKKHWRFFSRPPFANLVYRAITSNCRCQYRYNNQMKTASIFTTRNQLSALIEQVRHGEIILITDHDRQFARLIPVVSENGHSDELAFLERKGIQPGLIRQKSRWRWVIWRAAGSLA